MSVREAPAFGYHRITALLWHRYPFLFVDRVLEFDDGKRVLALKNVSINEPFFRGHFPQQPVMPGVLILEALAQAGALLATGSTEHVTDGYVVVLTGVDDARFRRAVLPGDQLVLEATLVKRRRSLWKMRGVARVDGHLTAEAQLTLTETMNRQL
jgi:3-hydroxyacyl-[acyl-carrier-protein] dehydratase